MEHLPWIIPLAIVLLLLFWAIATYNGLVSRRNETKNAWSQIDVQLKRRYDLIPNLVETAKGFMKHERETLEAVIRHRQTCVDLSSAGNVAELAKADALLTQSLKGFYAVSENYPELKANQNMMSLQEELASTENRIGFARQAYNDAVMRMNNAIEQFPASIVAGIGNFQRGAFWEVESAEERKNVKVSF